MVEEKIKIVSDESVERWHYRRQILCQRKAACGNRG
jgi:hypothetical protein